MNQDGFYLWIARFYNQELQSHLRQSSSLNFEENVHVEITPYSWGCQISYRWNTPQSELGLFKIKVGEDDQVHWPPSSDLDSIQKQAQGRLKKGLKELKKKEIKSLFSFLKDTMLRIQAKKTTVN